jgi:uncharacterized protein YkwD
MSYARNFQTARHARIATGLLLAATLAGGALSAPAVAAPAAPGTPAAPSASAKASTVQLRADVVSSVNKIRADRGCKPLRVASALTTSAQRHANDMSAKRYFSHTSADGRSWVSRQRAAGWNNPGGENIARGFDAAGPVMNAWMNSPLHRKNIVNCKFRYIGVGFAANGQYWVQNFGY